MFGELKHEQNRHKRGDEVWGRSAMLISESRVGLMGRKANFSLDFRL